MVDTVLRRLKPLEPLARRPQFIGFVIALLSTALILIAVFKGVVPFAAVVGAGFLALAVLVFRDLQDGDRAPTRRRQTHPKIAQVKRSGKRPAHRH